MFLASMSPRILLFAACLSCLQLCCLAQDVQARAEAMLQRARQLSDIRSPSAPAFRLKATFSFVGDDLATVQGTYTEIRVSQSQWRREIVVGDLRQVDIGGVGKHWILHPDGFPSQASRLPAVMTPIPAASSHFDFASITESSTSDVVAECAFTKPAADNQKSAFCFDKNGGVLLQKASPERRPRNLVSFSCEYGSFRKFGDYWFPREVVCFEDRHKTIEAKVVDLLAEPSPDPALFTAPSGAIELGLCSVDMKPPVAVSTPEPAPPSGSRDEVNRVAVTLSLVVDTKGKPQNVRVLRPGRKNFDDAALDAVRRWRFKPATCDGTPMSTEVNVVVDFAFYH
ncbi:MAG: TonB family protein [Candidatus Sulfotelmatobacter sp.]